MRNILGSKLGAKSVPLAPVVRLLVETAMVRGIESERRRARIKVCVLDEAWNRGPEVSKIQRNEE